MHYRAFAMSHLIIGEKVGICHLSIWEELSVYLSIIVSQMGREHAKACLSICGLHCPLLEAFGMVEQYEV